MINGVNLKTRSILTYACERESFGIDQLVKEIGANRNTVYQYLSILTKEKKLVRMAKGEYALPASKRVFEYVPSKAVERLYAKLKRILPYTDFCVYDGSIFVPFQHHVATNRAIYVETNREAVDTVFAQLKNVRKNVYKQPGASFMYDYVNLQKPCVIIKAFVTESPVAECNGVVVPTLEKLLVDMQKDADFDYMRGVEGTYMFQTAMEQYVVNIPRLFRYAKRRNAYERIKQIVEQTLKE